MILYNTTFCIDKAVHDDFVRYVVETVIPATSRAGMYGHLLTAVRGATDRNQLTGDTTSSLALQMRAPSQEVLDNLAASLLPRLFSEIGSRWQSKVAFFDTALDVIHDPAKK